MNSSSNGILVLDKPAGITSANTVAEVKRLFNAKKCGHAGTLDPFATGVLVCCMEQATRLARFLLHGDKKYEALLRLGTDTDTQDFTGRTVDTGIVPDIPETELRALFQSFVGSQMQQPPVYAALKHHGTPLYKLARQGNPVQKPARPVTIKQLRIVRIHLPEILFQVTCSAGTYIRTLCADIGRRIGCGGHLAQLRRTAAGGFSVDQAVTLATLKEKGGMDTHHQILIPMAEALGDLPEMIADDRVIAHILHGRQLTREMVPLPAVPESARSGDEYIKVVDRHRQLKAVIQAAPNGLTYNYCCVFH